ncbi:MAG TPA: hypothetical protein VER17_07300 [Tepidisphaeraceae bacterium]|nr:hypothetical protein [Tepidisphaeraceae bacterium]
MSRHARIGELLSRMVPLSGHDVEEILQEQASNRRKFGEIALSWGLCRPEHVWDAWCQQADDHRTLDLEKIGIDARAAAMIPAEVARSLGVIPVRVANDCALVAIAEDHDPDAAIAQLEALLHRRIKFARAEPKQVKAMIETYYGATVQ